jgi:hypothetical protein
MKHPGRLPESDYDTWTFLKKQQSKRDRSKHNISRHRAKHQINEFSGQIFHSHGTPTPHSAIANYHHTAVNKNFGQHRHPTRHMDHLPRP